jgi:hypothetical protein
MLLIEPALEFSLVHAAAGGCRLMHLLRWRTRLRSVLPQQVEQLLALIARRLGTLTLLGKQVLNVDVWRGCTARWRVEHGEIVHSR